MFTDTLLVDRFCSKFNIDKIQFSCKDNLSNFTPILKLVRYIGLIEFKTHPHKYTL